MIDWNIILSSTVIAASISGLFKLIDVIITARNKALRKKVRSLNAQINELQNTCAEQKATIEKLQASIESMTVHYNSNQRDSGYSDYISWEM